MLNPTLSLTQPKSPPLLSPSCPSNSSLWTPLVRSPCIVPSNRSKPARLSFKVKYEKESGYNLSAVAPTEETLKAIVSVQRTIGGVFSHIGLERGLDDITDLLGKSLLLEIVSAELDPSMVLSGLYNHSVDFFFSPNHSFQSSTYENNYFKYIKSQISS